MQWLDPWSAVADLGPGVAAGLDRVLARELAPGHPLHEVPVAAIGKHMGCDDVLFQLLDGSGRVAIVHLTWTQSPPERPPWPVTTVYASVELFAEKRMRPDHEEYLA